jgi:hypothetical protein
MLAFPAHGFAEAVAQAARRATKFTLNCLLDLRNVSRAIGTGPSAALRQSDVAGVGDA